MADQDQQRIEQGRAKAYQIASMHPSEPGYDPARSEKARGLLARLSQEHPITADTRETDFVDQVENGHASVLDRTGEPRDVPAGNLREGQTVRRAPQNTTPSTKDPTEQISVIPSPVAPGARTAAAVNHSLDDVPVARNIPYLASRYGNGLTMGLSDAIGDIAGTDSPPARERASEQAKVLGVPLGPAAEFAGAINPRSASTKAANGLVDLAKAGASRSPRVMALLRGAATVPGAAIAGRVAEGAGVGGTLGAVQGAAQNADSPIDMLNGGWAGFKGGAGVGALLGGVSGTAGAVADTMRTPDVALLEKYGMEPSAIPGRPVANKSEGTFRRIGNSIARRPAPTGVAKANPATVEQAGIDSARPIVEDVNARSAVNSAEMDRLRSENIKSSPGATEPIGPVVESLRASAGDVGAEPATRRVAGLLEKRLGEAQAKHSVAAPKPAGPELPPLPKEGWVPSRKDDFGNPMDKYGQYEDEYDHSKRLGQPTQDSEAKTKPDAKVIQPAVAGPGNVTPVDLQKIRMLADSKAKWNRTGRNSPRAEQEIKQLANAVRERIPEPLRSQDRDFSAATGRDESTREALGIGSMPADSSPNVINAAGGRIASAGKDTPEGVRTREQMRYLRENGAPEVMASARGKEPAPIDYTSLQDRPRVQIAQQGLQANPEAIMLHPGFVPKAGHLLHLGSSRLIYPRLNNAGNAEVGVPGGAGYHLIHALRFRHKQNDNQDQE